MLLFTFKTGTDAEILFKEGFQSFNDCLFRFSSLSPAKTADWRHKFIDVRSNSFHFSLAECIFQEFTSFFRFQFFLLYKLLQIGFTLFRNVFIPLTHYILYIIDTGNEGFYQLLLATKFWAGIYGLTDCNKNLFIFAVVIVVLFHQHQDVIDVDFYLLNQFDFKDDIINDVGVSVYETLEIEWRSYMEQEKINLKMQLAKKEALREYKSKLSFTDSFLAFFDKSKKSDNTLSPKLEAEYAKIECRAMTDFLYSDEYDLMKIVNPAMTKFVYERIKNTPLSKIFSNMVLVISIHEPTIQYY